MPSRLLDSTPAADGFHMPAEWEPHDRCYLVWPERSDNWRLGGQAGTGGVRRRGRSRRPERAGHGARLRRSMGACPGGVLRGDPGRRDDHRRRLGPGHRAHLRGQPPRRRAPRRGLGLQRLGRARRRALRPMGPRRPGGGQGLRARGRLAVPRPVRPRGRVDPRRRRGHVHHHRGVPAQPQPEPRSSRRAQIEDLLHERTWGSRRWCGSPAASFADETDGHIDNLACFSRAGPGPAHLDRGSDDPQSEISR